MRMGNSCIKNYNKPCVSLYTLCWSSCKKKVLNKNRETNIFRFCWPSWTRPLADVETSVFSDCCPLNPSSWTRVFVSNEITGSRLKVDDLYQDRWHSKTLPTLASKCEHVNRAKCESEWPGGLWLISLHCVSYVVKTLLCHDAWCVPDKNLRGSHPDL